MFKFILGETLIKQAGHFSHYELAYPKQIILICIFVTLPLQGALADNFFELFLKYTGISIDRNQIANSLIVGNIWKMEIDKSGVNEVKQVTRSGKYHSPIWIPGSDNLLAIKDDKLIQFSLSGGEEKILHNLPDPTILVGFNSNDMNSLLILQKSVPALLLLDSGEVIFMPFDKDNSEDSETLSSLKSSFRDYGKSQVYISEQSRTDVKGVTKKINKIHIKLDKQEFVISCPSDCAQPALIKNGRMLVFVGRF